MPATRLDDAPKRLDAGLADRPIVAVTVRDEPFRQFGRDLDHFRRKFGRLQRTIFVEAVRPEKLGLLFLAG